MLAEEAKEPFDSKDWIFEIKWDGYRAIAEIENGSTRLYSRNGNLFNNTYPVIVNELKKIRTNAILDGEIVVMDDNGNPSFQLLQNYQDDPDHPIYYYVFDLLSLKNKNTCDLPLLERKKLLKTFLKGKSQVRYADHIQSTGKEFFKLIIKKNLEGILAKKADSEYYPGKRSRNWLKIKHHKTQEAIICGFTEPTGTRKYFGALVLGLKQKDSFKYIGHTGSGFNSRNLKEVYDLLKPSIQKGSPFDGPVQTNMPVTWVRPSLVCEIKYSEWTQDGRMRHPIFLHLRPDKSINEIEMVKAIPTKAITKNSASEEKEKAYTFNSTKVVVTNTNKIFWPTEKITKGDVINYYINVGEYILPYLKDRPESLKRNPNGIKDKGFFHKDAGHDAPDWVKTMELFSESTNKNVNYIVCNNQATLTYLNNLGCIEINPWHSTLKALDNPDYMIIDIDPSDKNSFDQVIEVANVIHEILEKAHIKNLCKTSGASGMHVYVPLGKKYSYEQSKNFAELICILTNEQLPGFTSLVRNLKDRGKKIYLDHLQNRGGQTIASAYSLRPYSGATVSTPLKWNEVKPGLLPDQFNIYTMEKRLKKTGDLFKEVLGKGIDLEKSLSSLDR